MASSSQTVHLKVIKARNLRNADSVGKSDPYCVVKCVQSKQTFKTKWIKDNLNPEWNEQCSFSSLNANTEELEVTIFDKDDIGADDFLGRVEIPLKTIQANYNNSEQWWPLSGIEDGKKKHSSMVVTGDVLIHINIV